MRHGTPPRDAGYKTFGEDTNQLTLLEEVQKIRSQVNELEIKNQNQAAEVNALKRLALQQSGNLHLENRKYVDSKREKMKKRPSLDSLSTITVSTMAPTSFGGEESLHVNSFSVFDDADEEVIDAEKDPEEIDEWFEKARKAVVQSTEYVASAEAAAAIVAQSIELWREDEETRMISTLNTNLMTEDENHGHGVSSRSDLSSRLSRGLEAIDHEDGHECYETEVVEAGTSLRMAEKQGADIEEPDGSDSTINFYDDTDGESDGTPDDSDGTPDDYYDTPLTLHASMKNLISLDEILEDDYEDHGVNQVRPQVMGPMQEGSNKNPGNDTIQAHGLKGKPIRVYNSKSNNFHSARIVDIRKSITRKDPLETLDVEGKNAKASKIKSCQTEHGLEDNILKAGERQTPHIAATTPTSDIEEPNFCKS